MRWEDERYVRIYTRDTPDWLAMQWQGRAVFYELTRKVDRAGLVPIGKSGVRGLAGLLHMPVDVVEVGVEELVTDGCVVRVDGGLLIRNFLEAQETPQSDRARKRAQRERDRDSKRATAGTGSDVTDRDISGQPVTDRDRESRNVTESHAVSRAVTSGHKASLRTVPCRTVPNQKDPPYPPQAGVAEDPPGDADVAKKSRRAREDLTPSEQAYSDAYVGGQLDAEPGCGFRPLTAASCRLLGAIAASHAKDHDGSRLTGERLLEWFRLMSAEYRRAAEPQYAKGFAPHSFGTWLDSGRPSTRREPLPAPPSPPRQPREPPPPRPVQRMSLEDQRAKQQASIEQYMADRQKQQESTNG